MSSCGDYFILGLALERITGQTMTDLMQRKVLGPRRHTVLRGVHLLEPVLGHYPWGDPDHQHLRPARHRSGHGHRQAPVAVTYDPAAFDDTGAYQNEADILFRKIGAQLAPTDAPPMPPAK